MQMAKKQQAQKKLTEHDTQLLEDLSRFAFTAKNCSPWDGYMTITEKTEIDSALLFGTISASLSHNEYRALRDGWHTLRHEQDATGLDNACAAIIRRAHSGA